MKNRQHAETLQVLRNEVGTPGAAHLLLDASHRFRKMVRQQQE
jgi:hypothetical protein